MGDIVVVVLILISGSTSVLLVSSVSVYSFSIVSIGFSMVCSVNDDGNVDDVSSIVSTGIDSSIVCEISVNDDISLILFFYYIIILR